MSFFWQGIFQNIILFVLAKARGFLFTEIQSMSLYVTFLLNFFRQDFTPQSIFT